MLFEICTDMVEGVRAAARAGAHRVELCSSLFEGGLTPTLGMLREARRVPGIGLHAMVRPRGGDFLYDDDDFAAMLTDVGVAKAEGADGVVFGCLTPDGLVDEARTAALVAAARPLAVTFHRAFDMAAEPFAALETLVGLGVDRVLTSGQEATALEGLPLLAALVARAGERIVVMPGGGIGPRTVGRIVEGARPKEIHFAALRPESGGMRLRREGVFMGGELRQPEYGLTMTDGSLIGAVMAAARG